MTLELTENEKKILLQLLSLDLEAIGCSEKQVKTLDGITEKLKEKKKNKPIFNAFRPNEPIRVLKRKSMPAPLPEPFRVKKVKL